MNTPKYCLIFFLIFLICINNLGAQQIFPAVKNACGNHFQTINGGIDFNIGEPITGLISGNNKQVTQGLLQPNNFNLGIKIFLEGFYSGLGMMDNFGDGGCLYKLGISSDPTDVDTIRMTLLNSLNHLPVETSTTILKTDGYANFYFHSSTEGFYFLKINHRNSIETWSASPVLLTNGGVYDFTDAINKSFGNNETLTFDNSSWAVYSGDISDASTSQLGLQDGLIQFRDYAFIETGVQMTKLGYTIEDITGDGVVESDDYVLMENNVYYLITLSNP